MLEKRIKTAENRAHILDDEMQKRLKSNDRWERSFRGFATISLILLLLLAGIELYQANRLASQNKQHIDCIVKLLATPPPPGAKSRFISDASHKCNIKFTQ